ncbi:MAG: strawberry notch family protein [Nostoc sp.]|uniref:strawberry notch-like NTP hydrolase domain-containing protein n=1 Tax=Nostoc sp. TaxID=1180 RepID=UPI002FF72B64
MVQQLFTQGFLFDFQTVLDYGQSILSVGQELLKTLLENRPLNTKTVQAQMNRHFHGTAAEGTWQWKDAYEAVEVAQMLYLRQKGYKLLLKSPQTVLLELEKLVALCPTHTRRSEESVQLQQFSTPLPLAYLVAKAGFIQATDLVLEPSAGTGLLAQMAKLHSASLMLNELAPDRSKILRRLFPGTPLFSVNAEQINDYLVGKTQPSVVLMNPPFSASPKINSRNPDATKSHINSALQRLADGGRLVTITANWFSPNNPAWRETFVRWHSEARVLMSIGVNGKVYSKHGTQIDTRITVIDKVPADSSEIPCISETLDLPELLALIEQLPERSPWERSEKVKAAAKAIVVQLPKRITVAQPETVSFLPDDLVVLEYEVIEWTASEGLKDTLYETYRPQRIRIKDALPHPSLLCESAALALVSPPPPTYKPHLPRNIVSQGLLSEAQLESVIYAGQAHCEFLSGSYIVDDSWDNVTVAATGEENAVKFRRGWFLGDGTGAGKGRQCAGIILDNWCQGRRKAIWISKSAALIEDARRDWCALGGSEKDIIDLSNIKLGDPIPFTQGILFCTYSTLRSQKNGKSRLKQIVEWAGKDFDGAIAFDECHAMGNAMAQEGKLGMVAASQQGIVGLRLQNALPGARVVYVSATGATKVSNLSYANRLGLWQTGDFPFTSREDFVESIEGGGIAAMEVVARDLKALGLYLARSLSFEGIEYQTLEIELTPTQERSYNSYSDAFQVIHNNLEKALEACNISGAKTYNNRAAKMSANSQFESHKQRFFNHLLTGMKCPTLIKAIEQDLAQGLAVVIQIVSTNEELLKRRLDEVTADEWKDLNLDLTPREYVMDYLMSAFPIHLHSIHSGEDAEERSEPVFDADGSPVISQEAVALRDALVDKLASLDPIPGALEQLLWHFGNKQVAEVTGCSKRVLKDDSGRLFVDSRGSGANIAETAAFMADEKQILIFSDAGGTGRSYHADLNAVNRRRRSHYLLEAGWRADNAIQGLGRSHRTNQASAPVFRPVTTNVIGERRFISTIARRLDSLGALTRGQRQTGGNGIFEAKDNLESNYAEHALYELFRQIYQGRFYEVPLGTFEQMTGLSLTSHEGGMKIDLPPLRQFLNRLLALRIDMQNVIFERFELLLSQQIEAAIAAGVYEMGVETLRAERFTVESQEAVYTHPATGSVTNYLKIERVQKNNIKTDIEMLEFAAKYQGQFMVNEKGRAAITIPTHSLFDSEGGVVPRVLLIRPQKETRLPVQDLESSTWRQVSADTFAAAWSIEVDALPKFTTDYLHLVTGILLPIWKILPQQNSRVFRLQTSDGQKILGRVVKAHDIQTVREQLGLRNQVFSPEELVKLVLNERYTQQLPGGITLRRSFVANEPRIELVNAISLAERLLAVGCFTEIINWQKRLFIPVSDKAPAILAAVIEILG